MKQALFYVFLFVFGATAVVTLLGITQLLWIPEDYLDKLFLLLIVEVIASVITLFKKTDFFGVTAQDAQQSEDSKLSVLLLPKESFTRARDPHKCTISVYNRESDDEREISINLIRANGYLSAFLEKISEHELIKVKVHNSQNELWESDYFKPSEAKAEMVKI